MSVIAWDGKTLAADKQSTYGEQRSVVTKIFRVPQGLLGVTGKTEHMKPLLNWFNNFEVPELFPEFQKDPEENSAVLLITKERKIMCYGAQVDPFMIEQPMYATGCGKDFAMGAMLAGADARRAVEITCQLNVYCGMGIDILTLEG